MNSKQTAVILWLLLALFCLRVLGQILVAFFNVTFGYIYLFAMLLRYVVRMAVFPEERWLGGAIPIIFHWVLASFVITFGLFHRKQESAGT